MRLSPTPGYSIAWLWYRGFPRGCSPGLTRLHCPSCAMLAGNRMSRVSELCSLDTNSRVVLAVMKFLAHLTLSVEGQKLLVQVHLVSVMSDVEQNDRAGARLGTASDLMCCPSVWPFVLFSKSFSNYGPCLWADFVILLGRRCRASPTFLRTC